MDKEIKNILDTIARIIYDKKGFNIVGLDVKGISSMCDYMIIAEGNIDRHIKAISDEIIYELKKEKNLLPFKVEGKLKGDWIVIDYIDINVHLFVPELREKYQLEHLWKDGKIIEDLNFFE